MMNRRLNIFLSFTPFIALIIFLFIIIHFLQIDALAGGSQIALLFATSLCCAIALLVYKTKWTAIEKSFSDYIGYMDGERHCSYLDILWRADYSSKFLSYFFMHNLLYRIVNDG